MEMTRMRSSSEKILGHPEIIPIELPEKLMMKYGESLRDELREKAVNELSDKTLYVVDVFCGANKNTRMCVRFIMEVAWQAHFVTNMFIRPTEEELKEFKPDFVVFNASKAKCENYKELGLHSETVVAFNIKEREQVIINTWYGGEMKKGMFSMMNYFNPLRGIASMHCSANTNMEETSTAIFFGLSGTGKTTLSTDPKRKLIGDDRARLGRRGRVQLRGWLLRQGHQPRPAERA